MSTDRFPIIAIGRVPSINDMIVERLEPKYDGMQNFVLLRHGLPELTFTSMVLPLSLC